MRKSNFHSMLLASCSPAARTANVWYGTNHFFVSQRQDKGWFAQRGEQRKIPTRTTRVGTFYFITNKSRLGNILLYHIELNRKFSGCDCWSWTNDINIKFIVAERAFFTTKYIVNGRSRDLLPLNPNYYTYQRGFYWDRRQYLCFRNPGMFLITCCTSGATSFV